MLVQAGQSPAGLALAARYAELIFSGAPSLDAAVAFRDGLRARVVAAGARMIVAGNAIFGTADPERATRELKAAAQAALPTAGVKI